MKISRYTILLFLMPCGVHMVLYSSKESDEVVEEADYEELYVHNLAVYDSLMPLKKRFGKHYEELSRQSSLIDFAKCALCAFSLVYFYEKEFISKISFVFFSFFFLAYSIDQFWFFFVSCSNEEGAYGFADPSSYYLVAAKNDIDLLQKAIVNMELENFSTNHDQLKKYINLVTEKAFAHASRLEHKEAIEALNKIKKCIVQLPNAEKAVAYFCDFLSILYGFEGDLLNQDKYKKKSCELFEIANNPGYDQLFLKSIEIAVNILGYVIFCWIFIDALLHLSVIYSGCTRNANLDDGLVPALEAYSRTENGAKNIKSFYRYVMFDIMILHLIRVIKRAIICFKGRPLLIQVAFELHKLSAPFLRLQYKNEWIALSIDKYQPNSEISRSLLAEVARKKNHYNWNIYTNSESNYASIAMRYKKEGNVRCAALYMEKAIEIMRKKYQLITKK